MGPALLVVLSPCVVFDNLVNSTKGYEHVTNHDDSLEDLDFALYFSDGTVDCDDWTTQKVALHDGAKVYLRTLDGSYMSIGKV